MKRLLASVHDAPIVERDDGYRYLVHPISNGHPTLDPKLIREVVNGVVETAALTDVDKIVSPVTMGVHVAAAVSLVTDIPLVVVRDREYGLPGEHAFEVDGQHHYVNDVRDGDRVLLLDDLVSTGRTLSAIADAVEAAGGTVVDAVVVIRRVDTEDAVPAGRAVRSLVDVHVGDDGVTVVD